MDWIIKERKVKNGYQYYDEVIAEIENEEFADVCLAALQKEYPDIILAKEKKKEIK